MLNSLKSGKFIYNKIIMLKAATLEFTTKFISSDLIGLSMKTISVFVPSFSQWNVESCGMCYASTSEDKTLHFWNAQMTSKILSITCTFK